MHAWVLDRNRCRPAQIINLVLSLSHSRETEEATRIEPQTSNPSVTWPVQVTLRAREAILRYYDGRVQSDDELSKVAEGMRDVVLRPTREPHCLAHPDASKGGAVMRREISERALYLQVSASSASVRDAQNIACIYRFTVFATCVVPL